MQCLKAMKEHGAPSHKEVKNKRCNVNSFRSVKIKENIQNSETNFINMRHQFVEAIMADNINRFPSLELLQAVPLHLQRIQTPRYSLEITKFIVCQSFFMSLHLQLLRNSGIIKLINRELVPPCPH